MEIKFSQQLYNYLPQINAIVGNAAVRRGVQFHFIQTQPVTYK